MHARLDRIAMVLGDDERLDDIMEALRVLEVDGLEAAQPLTQNLVDLDAGTKAQRHQHAQLVRCIPAVDVERGIGLGVAERLRLLEYLIERPRLVGHGGEKEVGGAVDDPDQLIDAVGGEALPERADDRYPAADGGLEVQVDAAAL